MQIKQARSILLIANQQIGDVLLSTSILHDLRVQWPQAKIDVLVFQNTAGILEGNADCDEVIAVAHRPTKAGYWQLFKKIFRRYDIAITTQGNDRAHLYAFWAASQRIGLVPDLSRRHWWKRLLCQHWVLLDETHTHTVVQNSLLLRPLHVETHCQIGLPKSLQAEQALSDVLDFDWQHQPYVVIHPFPMWQYKRWTSAGWQQLIQHIVASGTHVVMTGGPQAQEMADCAALSQLFSARVSNIAGRTSFAVLARLLQTAQAYVGPDTVTTHLAAACNTPTLAIFGPSNPVKWGPWPYGCQATPSPWKNVAALQSLANVTLIQGLGDCVPCHQAGCYRHNQSHSRCLDDLSASRVIAAYQALPKKLGTS